MKVEVVADKGRSDKGHRIMHILYTDDIRLRGYPKKYREMLKIFTDKEGMVLSIVDVCRGIGVRRFLIDTKQCWQGEPVDDVIPWLYTYAALNNWEEDYVYRLV